MNHVFVEVVKSTKSVVEYKNKYAIVINKINLSSIIRRSNIMGILNYKALYTGFYT
ncbi:hypothetical protein HNR53_003710 [Bacillus benzoevorans]|uniref:Uncharacterized protein n=1 Tax=Bacillus benzoevorans TaxID=1456 RepID=A0A7X0HUF4_9BACI|nr:hypothetical protein [Bacillus benzoevorans]